VNTRSANQLGVNTLIYWGLEVVEGPAGGTHQHGVRRAPMPNTRVSKDLPEATERGARPRGP